jgi:hypothetical protein
MLATGAILLATTPFLPQLVQQDFGYTATWAGLLLSPGGVVTMVMMFVVGRLAAKVQPKYLIVAGAVIHREQFHQSRLVESVLPSSVQYQDTLHRVTDYFVAQGNSLLQAQQQAVQWIGQQVQAQASFLAYGDAFWVLMLISLAAVPLALTLRKVKLGGPFSVH